MIDVSHLENATTPLSFEDIYRPALKLADTKEELLPYFCSLTAYYIRVEGLSKQEAGNLASHTLALMTK